MSVPHDTQLLMKPGTLAMSLASIITNNINFTFGYQISPISICFLFGALMLNRHILFAQNHIKILLFFLICTLVITSPFANPVDLFKDLMFFMTIIFGLVIASDQKFNLKLIKITIILILTILILQFLPQYMDFHKIIFHRASTTVGRGFTSFLGEPSFLAATSTIILLNYTILVGYLDYKDPYILLIVSALLLSFSSMALFGLMFVFWKIRLSLFAKSVVVLLGILLLWPLISNLNVRMIHFMLTLLSGQELDVSANSRLFYILKDLKIFLTGFAIPLWGPGGYHHAMVYMNDIQIPENFIYNPNMSGSLLGRYLVCFGFFVLLIPIMTIHKTSKKKFFEVVLYLSFLILVIMQMIPTGLVPFNLFVGSFFASLLRFSRD